MSNINASAEYDSENGITELHVNIEGSRHTFELPQSVVLPLAADLVHAKSAADVQTMVSAEGRELLAKEDTDRPDAWTVGLIEEILKQEFPVGQVRRAAWRIFGALGLDPSQYHE